MSARITALLAVMLALSGASAAHAADLSAEIGVVSDYRYRGLSLSDGKPAIQASAPLEHQSGLYLNLWTSSIKEPGSAMSAEIDLAAGYEAELSKNVTLDLSATYYLYPADRDADYVEASAIIAIDAGDVTPSLGMSLAPGQRATRDELGRARRNLYLFGELAYEIPGSPITLQARAGHERGAFDEVDQGGKWDWSIGADWSLGRARIGFSYVGCGPERVASHALLGSLLISFGAS